MAPEVRNPTRYQVLGEHGRGGLGRVSRARDLELGRDIAIKELLSRNHISEVRFMREALITARLEHPGIVPIYEAGRWPDGTPFYAMKLVAGRSLRDLIAERTTVDERIRLLHHVIAVADAIAYAHGRNIIHRDLKPSNVIIGDFGETVVIDWGLAKDLTVTEEASVAGGPVREVHDDGLTSAGTILGTPAYMAPEQARGEDVDQRADVYAIGAMLWELCALQKLPPKYSGQRTRILRSAGIDSDLISIIDKACAPAPHDRYPGAGALAADLKAFTLGARIAARRYSLVALLAHWTRRHRRLASSLIGLILATFAVGGLYVRNIAVERDRADAARAETEHARVSAAMERDRAQLSEAAMWLEKDPTQARALLRTAKSQVPQQVLLLSEAESRAAAHVLTLSSRVEDMQISASNATVAIVTINGELVTLDAEKYATRIVDTQLTGPLINSDGHWCYSRIPENTDAVVLSGCGDVITQGGLLRRPSAQLVVVNGILYALESANLYRLGPKEPLLIREGVRALVSSGQWSLLCSTDGRLEVLRSGARFLQSTCAPNDSAWPMAVNANHYVALAAPGRLISDRGEIVLPTPVKGEYALSLGKSGTIALSDLSGEAWVIGPNDLRPVSISGRAAHPAGISVNESLVAVGYSDGDVIVVDVANGHRWEFAGHQASVMHVAIDAVRRQVISTADNEIRIWELLPPPVAVAATTSCEPFHIIPTSNPHLLATDCSDGRALVWNIENNHLATLHQHKDLAFGIVAYHDQICTGGWDGRVLCNSVRGDALKEVLAANERVRALITSNDRLFAAIADGNIFSINSSGHRVLYKSSAMPSQFIADLDGDRIASGAYDGSVVVYDLTRDRIDLQAPHAHDGLVTGLGFLNGRLLSTGTDAKIREWQLGFQPRLLSSKSAAGSLKRFHVFKGGWMATVNDRTFLMYEGSQSAPLELSVPRAITDVAISSDERYAAFAALDEIVVIDRQRDALATATSPASNFGCLRFVDSRMLAACDQVGIASLSFDSLNFFPMHTQKGTP